MSFKRLAGNALCFILVVAWGTPPALAQAEYVVTLDPIRIDSGPGGICIAIDPADRAGVWWWGSGRSGCATRNTMAQPNQESVTGLAVLFHPVDAVVSHTPAGETEARFRLALHGPPDHVDLVLIVRGDQLESSPTGMNVGIKRVRQLDIPLLPPYGSPIR